MWMTKRLETKEVPETLSIEPETNVLLLEEGFGALPSSQGTTVTVGRGGVLTYVANLLPSAAVRRSITVKLEEGARAEFLGFVAAKNDAAVTLTLHEDHTGQDSWARTTVRSLLDGRAALQLLGKISIRPSANRSDGLFEGRAILLSDDARATIIPSLEIEASDVKATHAAAAAPIDPEELFYVQSRGCTLKEAERLILWGFFDALIARIPTDGARDWVLRRWHAALTL